MKFLWIATKAPWPPRDGGRLALWSTIRALRAAGHSLELVAPHWGDEAERREAEGQLGAWCDATLVPWRPRSAPLAWLLALRTGAPWTVERHRSRPVRRWVEARLRGEPRDVVVAEQLQATAQFPTASCFDTAGRPRALRVLRAQNVESELWEGQARSTRGPLGPWLRTEARRLHRAERGAVRELDGVAAISERDAEAFRALAAGDRPPSHVMHLPVPFEPELAPADAPLSGSPAVVLLGSVGWRPNEAAGESFLTEVWPAIREALPQACLHAFGLGDGARAVTACEGVVFHPSPPDSRDAFAPGAVLAVPLAVASGVRMKILEAWARGVAVVASPVAAAGLDAAYPRALAVARSPREWVEAMRALHGSGELHALRVAAGREILARAHSAEGVVGRWVEFLAGLRR